VREGATALGGTCIAPVSSYYKQTASVVDAGCPGLLVFGGSGEPHSYNLCRRHAAAELL
jgi:hypothetical protein